MIGYFSKRDASRDASLVSSGGTVEKFSTSSYGLAGTLINEPITIGSKVTSCSDMFNNCSNFNSSVTFLGNGSSVKFIQG